MARFGWRVAVGGMLPLLAGCALFGKVPVESPEAIALRTEREAGIRAEVEARLAHEPSLGPGAIRVVVNRTDVHLHGSVHGPGALRCALTVAGLVRGVTLVVDYLVLQPGPADTPCLAPRAFPAG